jgi:filamentous hemagglutinin
VKGWQGSGDYPGVDEWATATIPAGLNLYGGLPGQSEYYTIAQTLIDADTMETAYWESLQVKAHPTFGYRPDVGIFDLNTTTTVAISRTLANPQYGKGEAWQVYMENYKTGLTALNTVSLQK